MNESSFYKKKAALEAVEFIESGMILGLGSGSTAWYALEEIGKRIKIGLLESIVGIPSSSRTAELARQFGIPMGTLDDFPVIDLTIDGADEVDPELNLIKGGGGALLHEKILAQNSRRVMIIVDQSKLAPALGTNCKLPLEVVPFSLRPMLSYLESLGAQTLVRTEKAGQRFVTDEGNFLLDCKFDPISNPRELAQNLKKRAGLVEHGLFLGLATDVIVAGEHETQHIKS
ncbi:MAG TPA: ribose-5-phosphate isomerase RpiA [bacterium]|nr:ribose-5-phosphate isomerase RpiA [bacterium]